MTKKIPHRSTQNNFHGTLLQQCRQELADLYDNAAFLRRITDNMDDLVLQIDLRGIIQYISPACKMQGYAQENVLGLCAFDFVHADDLPKVQGSLEKLLTSGMTAGIELRLRNNMNEYAWFEIRGKLLYGETNEPTAFIIVCRNADERKRFENTLRISEKKYFKAFHASADTFIIARLSDQCLIDVNEAFIRKIGLSRDEIIGRSIFDLGLDMNPQIYQKMLEQLYRNGSIYNLELSVRNKNGELRIGLFTAEVFDLDGEPHIIAVWHDITDRKHVEEKLRIQNTYLQSLHETTFALLNRLDVNELLETIICRASDLLNIPHAFIFLVDTTKNVLELKTGIGACALDIGREFTLDEGLSGTIWRTGQPMFVNNYQNWEGRSFWASSKNVQSAIGAPLISAHEIIGVVGLHTTEANHHFDDNDLMVLSRFAELASLALDNARLHTAVQRELMQRKQAEEQLRYINSHDSLTGLFNRAYFEEIMYSFPTTEEIIPAVVVYDVDGLKLINDTMGHHAGDQLLVTAAHIVKTAFPEEAVVARVGGDEFVAILRTTNLSQLEYINKQINQAVKRYNAQHPQLPLSLSSGHALKCSCGDTIDSLFKEADDNMYREKLHRGQSTRSMIVQGLLKALEARDFITEGHGERLEELVVALALVLCLSERHIADLRLLAKFHDIGKVGIADNILFKPASLTPAEYVEMQRHSEIGHRIALSATDLVPIADYILHHHEWWNGKGYPLGLKEQEIPLACRILAIADAYDAMTNDRPYRKALSHEHAITELKKHAAVQFDPQLVDCFIELLDFDNSIHSKVF